MPDVQRFLVKMLPPAAGTALTLAGASLTFRPLFSSIGVPKDLAAGPQAQWHVVEAGLSLTAGNPWDLCHAMVTRGLRMAGAAPLFAEPDLTQSWLSGSAQDQQMALTASCAVDPQDKGFPVGSNNFWYQDAQHGQFAGLLKQLGNVPLAKAVRVAHLDTGYDPDHQCLPVGLERNLARNFVDANRPNDATDDTSGLLNNLGHGTGTLSILAGSPVTGLSGLGAAPFVKVVPIRVANRVVLFNNSAIAQAFDYVHGLCQNAATSVQVVSMSMGGVASEAWADAVNALYEEGVVVVTAAGNNFGNLPTHNIVYPARFNRVIAACGVMENHTPYADLPRQQMAGNYGPNSKMNTAMAAYTPNVPWAKFGCSSVVDYDGAGTSAATPQIAAAAAIWLQKNGTACSTYPQKWMRVEAVRKALFDTSLNSNPDRFGRGELRALDAFNVPAAKASDLKQEPADSASFAFLRVLTGLGMTSFSGAQQRMLELEALQLSQSASVEAILPDPNVDPDSLTLAQRVAIAQALAQHPRASQALRRALQLSAAVVPVPGSSSLSLPPAPPSSRLDQLQLQQALSPQPPTPVSRRLRVYAYDPSLGRALESVAINQTTLSLLWEPELAPGPVGEYLEVVDIDPASGCCYAPVDLNDPRLLASDGLQPSEANPQFHQQMAYAVAMNTIRYFELALGRVALWAPRFTANQSHYVQRLRIYPHALRAANAFYSPPRKALLLGYFESTGDGVGAPGETIFTALSHDIVAHETTHALLDGLHRRFIEPTNPDVLAFHEGFADIVALFQHFTLRDSLRELLARSRGDLSQGSMLAWLAVQFGRATGHYKALRDAIGTEEQDANGDFIWKRAKPSTSDYQSKTEAHDRGSVLVSAVFDAFLQVYSRRALVPIRLSTHGSEVLPAGALQGDLVDALTDLASKVAKHVLTICIRALDYCPPVDITFGDFLRAVITADQDLVADDPHGYRVAFAAAFMARGIYPEGLRTYSVDTLRWEPPLLPLGHLEQLLPKLSLQWTLQTRRETAWSTSRSNAAVFHAWLMDKKQVGDDELAALGLHRKAIPNYPLSIGNQVIACSMHGIEVHSVRPSRRVGPDGQLLSQLVVELTQSLYAKDGSRRVFRGGVTLLINTGSCQVAYVVRKRLDQPARIERQQQFQDTQMQAMTDKYRGLQGLLAEPFALLHRDQGA
ncbi:S8 family serine peptidase [Pseudomonas sp. NA-150]|uniref:S8 family serine peptidase n=1 Tax=Pseudomonas sp. NA-150 TaxID=3367525 RepID=UPI0037CA9204